MAFALQLTTATFSTGLYGQALASGRGVSTPSPLPQNGTFTAQVSFNTTVSTLAVMVGQLSAFWIGVKNGLLTANYGTGGGEQSLVSGTNVADGQWHTARLVLNSSGATLLLDGVVTAQGSVTMTGAGASYTADMEVSTLGNGYNWSGLLDEVAVFSTGNASPYTPSLVADSTPSILALYHLNGDGANSAAPTSSVPTNVTATGGTNQNTMAWSSIRWSR